MSHLSSTLDFVQKSLYTKVQALEFITDNTVSLNYK